MDVCAPGMTIEIMGDDTGQEIVEQAGAGVRLIWTSTLSFFFGFNGLHSGDGL
jgi:hypothetical protein